MEVSLVLTACVVLAFFANIGQCCGPAEIGQQHAIKLAPNVPSDARVVWQLLVQSNSVVLYDSGNASLIQAYPHRYTVTKTELIILNVTLEDGQGAFQQIVNGESSGVCNITVYKRASTPRCENVTLTRTEIKTTCTTNEVYPQAKCKFTLQSEVMDHRVITDGPANITYTHTDPQERRKEYYSTSCTLQYPLDGLKPGNWTVQVNMYPDLTGVSLAQGTRGQPANVLSLSVPTVTINATNCPKGPAGEGDSNVRNGYIRQGERASCTCTRAHVGNPPGTISWRSTQGGNFVNLPRPEESDAATIQINSPDKFTCQSISVLDGSSSITYTPKYAYGPNSSSLIFQRPGPIYLCPNQQRNIDIICQVPSDSFNPATLFTITDDNNNKLATKVAGDDAWSKSVKYNFTESGQHIFRCQVENAIFSDIFVETSASHIQVYAPPISPPSFKVTGKFVQASEKETWVKQGSNISVSCSVGDAYPLVNSNNVNAMCGEKNSSYGRLDVFGVSGDELKCRCVVDHETKTPCNSLNLTNDKTIQIAYGPEDVTMSIEVNQHREVRNEPLNLCSSEGLSVTVVCAVNSSGVKPGLTNSSFTLTKPGAFTITQLIYQDISEVGDYRLINKLNVTSGGIHNLSCEARNTKFADIKKNKSMIIEVREPPKHPPKISAHNSQNLDILVEGDEVTVTCDASGGHPSVDSVTLTCGQDQSVTSNGTFAELTLNEISLSYNQTNCTCQASHVTGCYDQNGVLPLTILMSNHTLFEQEDSPPIGAAVGGAIGVFVVIAVVVGGIFVIRRSMKKKQQPSPEEGGYDPHQDPTAVFKENDLYGTARQEERVSVPAKDYTTVKPTMETATALPKKYNPENADRPYEDVNPVDLDRKPFLKKSQTKPTPGAKPKIPKTSLKTNAVPKPGEQAQNNTDSEYATVAKTKPSHSKSSDHDQTDDVTTAGATGAMPVVPNKLYDKDEFNDSVNQQSASKGKQKKTKENSAKKEKKKDKKEKTKKENDHIYSNEIFDRSGDADVYANIAMGMKSTNDVDDGMHKNKDGLVYTTIVGVGSLKGAQRPVHHSRKEAPVDYADIDFNEIVANREDQD